MSMAQDAGLHLTGIEQLRAMAASGKRAPIGQLMGFTLVEVEEGRAVFEGRPARRSTTRSGPSTAVMPPRCSTRPAGLPCIQGLPRGRDTRRSS